MTQATAPGVEVELEEVTLQLKPQERRRSSIALTLPGGMDQQNLAASVNIGADEVEFEAHGVKINHQGLFIEGTNVSEVHQDAMSMLCELGRGACSVVKKAQHVETRELYAIKIFSVFDREKRGQLLKEVETLWGMECPSLINFVGGYLKNGSIHVVLEYMDRGSLADLIHDWSGLEYGESLMAAIVFQILWGLGYLHYENHVHRDVKPQNVLLNSKGEVKISDFGIARELEGEMDLAQTMVGTIRYMSPERLAGAGYGVAADVWSLGVVLLEMAARRLPFDTTVSQIELHDKLQDDLVLDDLMKLVPGHSAHFEEVLRGCLQTRPEDRLSPEQLLQLEWFRQFRLPAEENDAEKTEPVPGPVAIPVPVPVVPAPVPAPAPVTVPAAVDEVVVAAAAAVSEEESMEAAAVTVAVEEPLEVSMEESPGAEDEEGAGGAGSEGSEGDSEGEGDVDEQHDLDRAAQVVREYILKGVECGILSAERPRMSMFPGLNGTNGGLRDSTGSGMLRTMYSDGGLSDSDDSKAIFGTLRDEDFGGFAGFEKEMSVPFDGHNLGIN